MTLIIVNCIIILLFGTACMTIADKTIWGGWLMASKEWGWKEWFRWFATPKFYFGLAFVFGTTFVVMKTVRDLWFQ